MSSTVLFVCSTSLGTDAEATGVLGLADDEPMVYLERLRRAGDRSGTRLLAATGVARPSAPQLRLQPHRSLREPGRTHRRAAVFRWERIHPELPTTEQRSVGYPGQTAGVRHRAGHLRPRPAAPDRVAPQHRAGGHVCLRGTLGLTGRLRGVGCHGGGGFGVAPCGTDSQSSEQLVRGSVDLEPVAVLLVDAGHAAPLAEADKIPALCAAPVGEDRTRVVGVPALHVR